MTKTPLEMTYQSAGVSIDRGNQFVQMIKPLLAKTKRREVIGDVGSFAGLFAMNPEKYSQPVLVATTDGVGTKLKLAHELNHYHGIGQDLVAMCVNDLICCGAEPLFFLDYFATGELDLGIAQTVLEGMTSALAKINCALIGGETAEMPGVYQGKEIDLAGFSVGVVNRGEIIHGSDISIGNKVIGLASNGPHSNGFSLIRKIIDMLARDSHFNIRAQSPELGGSVADILLAPTRIYVNTILKLKKEFSLLGLAHITGGGLLENVPRVLPQSCAVVIDRKRWPVPPIFKWLQEKGNVPTMEMFRVFNMGIGFVLIVPEQQEAEIVLRLEHLGEMPYVIGEVVERRATNDQQLLLV